MAIGLTRPILVNLIQAIPFGANCLLVFISSLPSLILAWHGTIRIRKWKELNYDSRWACVTSYFIASGAALILAFAIPLSLENLDANDVAVTMIFVPGTFSFVIAIAFFVGWALGKSIGGVSLMNVKGLVKLAVAASIIFFFAFSGFRIASDAHWKHIAMSPLSSEKDFWKAYEKGVSRPGYISLLMNSFWNILFFGRLSEEAFLYDQELLETLAGNPACPREILLNLQKRRDELALQLLSSKDGWRRCYDRPTKVCATKVPKEFTKYWFNHPLCSEFSPCGNRYFVCNNTCPPPQDRDR